MSDMNELFEKWSKIKNIHRFEGETGVGDLTILVQDIGYDGIEDFLENNSGAIEKIVDFIASNDVPEWQSNLNEAIRLHEEDEDEEKSSEFNPKRGVGTGFVAIQCHDAEDEIWWGIVSKEFWEQNHYLNDRENLPIIPEFSEIMESTYEYHGEKDLDVEQQTALLKSLGFDVRSMSEWNL